MKVNLKCFARLSKEGECDFRDSTPYEIDKGETVYDLANRAKILPKDIEIAFINNKIVSLETVLADGDNVGLAPAVGGM